MRKGTIEIQRPDWEDKRSNQSLCDHREPQYDAIPSIIPVPRVATGLHEPQLALAGGLKMVIHITDPTIPISRTLKTWVSESRGYTTLSPTSDTMAQFFLQTYEDIQNHITTYAVPAVKRGLLNFKPRMSPQLPTYGSELSVPKTEHQIVPSQASSAKLREH